jgi:hypothetical protein
LKDMQCVCQRRAAQAPDPDEAFALKKEAHSMPLLRQRLAAVSSCCPCRFWSICGEL